MTEDFPAAMVMFERSLEYYGPDPNTYYKMASSSFEMGQMQNALEYLEKTLVLAPTFESALAMQKYIKEGGASQETAHK